MSDRTKTIRSLCPLCDVQIPSLRIEEGQLLVKCDHRKEYSYYTFEDYLQRIEEKKNVLCTYSRICKTHNEPFSAYCRGCDSSICDNARKSILKIVMKRVRKVKNTYNHLKVFLTHCFK